MDIHGWGVLGALEDVRHYPALAGLIACAASSARRRAITSLLLAAAYDSCCRQSRAANYCALQYAATAKPFLPVVAFVTHGNFVAPFHILRLAFY
jgi:hypothetical protein